MVRVPALMVILALAFVTACGKPANKAAPPAKGEAPKAAAAPRTPPPVAAEVPPPSARSAWVYKTGAFTDGTPYQTACVTSANLVHLAPEQPDVNAVFCLRRRGADQEDAYLQILGQTGLFDCPSGDHCTPQFRFDDQTARRLEMTPPTSGAVDLIFLDGDNLRDVLEGIRGAESMTILADYDIAGMQDARFDVSGLRWPPARN